MRTKLAIACVLVLIAATPKVLHATDHGDGKIQITVVSGRPDMISGGDALIRIEVPGRVPLKKIVVKLNDQTATSNFHADSQSYALIGLLEGLRVGDNSFQVFTDGKGRAAPAGQLTLKDYPITGPIFSGPHEKPFLCETAKFKLPDGSTLGPALDDNCSVKTVVQYVYKSTAPVEAPPDGKRAAAFKRLPSTTQLPADVAWTTTATGEKVPYVVRIETGTINRSIYQIAILDNPTAGLVGPFAPPKAWNGRLLYSFGGGCVGGWYRQGDTLGFTSARDAVSPVVNDNIVGKGYAEVSSSLNVAGNNCNDTISAETTMMIKEHFIKTFGEPVFTFGRGASGGSYQQNQIADRYPGLLDGIIPSLTFPDVQELVQMITDARLLAVYYDKVGAALTSEQKRAIAGVAEIQNVTASAPLAGRINPTEYCLPALPSAVLYNRFTNPSGVRCDIYDHNINLYGPDPATGFARHPVDNTGVQYGLTTLNDRTITVEQFLDLNENIGGYDNNGRVVGTRSSADPVALRNAYQTGVITFGGNGLSKIPIIDVRPYRDKLPSGDNHLKYHSFAYRERLRIANGTFENEVMLTGPAPHGGLSSPVDEYALTKMDEWLTSLGKDTSSDPILKKIVRAKPADLVDSCWTTDGERIIEPQTLSGGKCNSMYPAFPGPRMVAGGPLANNVLKCQLKPIDPNDYKVPFTKGQKHRLSEIFPNGVCDWSKPGVEQQPPVATWQSYMSGAPN
jgi:Tannase-like family of unknown function (DUF6351)